MNNKILIIFLIILVFASPLKAEVLGFFINESGIRGIVKLDKPGCHSTNVRLFFENKSKDLRINGCEWKLSDNEINSADFSKLGLRGKFIQVKAEKGFFYIPIFGTTFLSKESCNVYFETNSGKINKINLGINGGEIKGFKILKDKLVLFVYERKTGVKIKEGRKLYWMSSYGTNAMIDVFQDKVGYVKKINIKDSNLYWIENNTGYYIDSNLQIKEIKLESNCPTCIYYPEFVSTCNCGCFTGETEEEENGIPLPQPAVVKSLCEYEEYCCCIG